LLPPPPSAETFLGTAAIPGVTKLLPPPLLPAGRFLFYSIFKEEDARHFGSGNNRWYVFHLFVEGEVVHPNHRVDGRVHQTPSLWVEKYHYQIESTINQLNSLVILSTGIVS